MNLSSILSRSAVLASLLLAAACGPLDPPIVISAADIPQNPAVEMPVQSAEQK